VDSTKKAHADRNLTTKTQRHKERPARPDSTELLKEAAGLIGRSEAEYLLMHVLKVPRHRLLLKAEVATRTAAHFRRLVSRTGKGEPVQYVTHSAPFLDFEVHVDHRVLIPRPETEELVVRALSRIRSGSKLQAVSNGLTAVDYGTGSGCIAIALARALPAARITAVDASKAALAVAAKNVAAYGLAKRIRLTQAQSTEDRVLSRMAGRLDLLISNPPYVPTRRLVRLDRAVRREPRLALDGGPKGANIVAMLVTRGPALLKPGGLLAVEIDDTHEAIVRRLAPRAEIERDLAGRIRYVFLRK
jgi:release factor glutamine methyltransferase